MSEGLRIRAATPGDLTALLALERATEGAPHWPETAWQRALSPALEKDAWKRVVFVVEGDAGVLGFIAGACVSGIAEVESVAVATEARCRGAGMQLLRALIEWARDEQQAERVELEVRESNAAARALYASAGFCEQGRRAGYYNSPREDAVLLVLALEGPTRAK